MSASMEGMHYEGRRLKIARSTLLTQVQPRRIMNEEERRGVMVLMHDDLEDVQEFLRIHIVIPIGYNVLFECPLEMQFV